VTAFSLGLFTFVCAFGGALIGSYARSMLPPPHLSKESQDVMRLGMGLVATMTALLLGLVTASARSTFDSQDVSVRTSAANILTLDRLLARYGPETATPRELLRQTLTYRIEEIWPSDGSRGGGLSTMPLASPPVENLENMILALSPANDGQRWIKTEALKISQEVVKARWRILTSQGGTVSMVFLGVVIFWLTVTFASFRLPPRSSSSSNSTRRSPA
jgi:hypothetical protein